MKFENIAPMMATSRNDRKVNPNPGPDSALSNPQRSRSALFGRLRRQRITLYGGRRLAVRRRPALHLAGFNTLPVSAHAGRNALSTCYGLLT